MLTRPTASKTSRMFYVILNNVHPCSFRISSSPSSILEVGACMSVRPLYKVAAGPESLAVISSSSVRNFYHADSMVYT